MDIVFVFAMVSLALFGAIFGSFANVVIWRFPRGESVASPPSHCPSCGHDIRWYDNVPVLSWLVLRAKCRDCGTPISWRYPAVEALTALAWLSCGLIWGVTLRTAFAVVFAYLLIILAFIDLDTMRLPNPLVALLAVVGLAGAAWAQLTGAEATPLVGIATSGLLSAPLVSAALGALLGAGLSLGIALTYGAVRGRSGFGMGDVKLLGAMGFFLGGYVLLAFFFGSLVGAVVAIAGRAGARGGEPLASMKIPFGPYLAAGGIFAAAVGPAALGWYLRLVGF